MKKEKFLDELKKYQKTMERMFYIFLVWILLYEVMGTTSILYYFTSWIASGMIGMDPALAGLLFQSVVNLRFLIVIPAIYTVITEPMSKKKRALLVAMLLLGWFYLFYMREWNDTVMFKFLILIVAAYGKDFKKIAKCSIGVVGFVVVLSTVLSIMGVIPEYNMIRNGVVRHSFGTLGPTAYAGHVAFLLLTGIYILDGELSIAHFMLIIVLSILNLLFVDGRAALLVVFLATMAAICAMILRRKKWAWAEKLSHIVGKGLIWSYVIIAGLYMILMVTYKPNPDAFYHKISFLSSFEGRVSVPNGMMKELPASLFGNYFEKYDAIFADMENHYVTGEYTFLDSSYARCYMIYGVVGLIVTVLVFTGIQYRLYREKQLFRMVLLAITGLFFVVQRGLIEPGSDIFLMILFATISEATNKRKRIGNK